MVRLVFRQVATTAAACFLFASGIANAQSDPAIEQIARLPEFCRAAFDETLNPLKRKIAEELAWDAWWRFIRLSSGKRLRVQGTLQWRDHDTVYVKIPFPNRGGPGEVIFTMVALPRENFVGLNDGHSVVAVTKEPVISAQIPKPLDGSPDRTAARLRGTWLSDKDTLVYDMHCWYDGKVSILIQDPSGEPMKVEEIGRLNSRTDRRETPPPAGQQGPAAHGVHIHLQINRLRYAPRGEILEVVSVF